MISFILDKILNEKELTRYWLSKQTGIDANTIDKIYKNTAKQIQLETLDKIIKALNCDLSDILEYK